MPQSASVVGIDVSKRALDVYFSKDQERKVANDAAGHQDLVIWFKALGVSVVVMEASGGYEKDLARALRRAGFAVHVVDPKRVRHYAQAIGQLAKTDRIDARIICQYGAAIIAVDRLPLPMPDDPARERLGDLLAARADLVEHGDALKQQIDALAPGPARQALQRVHTRLQREIAQLERRMTAVIDGHPPFASLARRLDTVPGLGPVSIAAILAWLPELGHADRRRISALVGVAPVAWDTGESHGRRCIAGGRKKLRNILYMATLAATQWNPVLKAHYEQLKARGKEAKVALIACLRRLLGILTAMVVKQQDWAPPPLALAA
jgi:transposase